MSSKSLFLELLGVKGQVKIIELLYDKGEMTITQLAKAAGLNHKWARQHLKVLVDNKVVEVKAVGSIRIYKLNSKNMVVNAIVDLITTIRERKWQ